MEIHSVATPPYAGHEMAAQIFASQLLRALHRRLGFGQYLVAFDGRRSRVSSAEVCADTVFATPVKYWGAITGQDLFCRVLRGAGATSL